MILRDRILYNKISSFLMKNVKKNHSNIGLSTVSSYQRLAVNCNIIHSLPVKY
jgi:hypothetical protein